MNRKTLKFNKFGESILNDFDLFYIWVNEINLAYPKSAGKTNINKLKFRWYWNNYNGHGEICYFNDSKKLCNQFGENFSNMTIDSNSKKQQANNRHNCALYNDKSLAELFIKILDMVDLKSEIYTSN